MPSRIPFPENVPGDFYVEDGCCLSCGMPTTVAPDLFAYAADGHCFVKKQPSTSPELEQMMDAFEVQDAGCIRYNGRKRAIQIRLIEVNEGDQCDTLPPDLTALNEEMKSERIRMRSKK